MMVDDGRYYEVLVDMVDMVDGRYSTKYLRYRSMVDMVRGGRGVRG